MNLMYVNNTIMLKRANYVGAFNPGSTVSQGSVVSKHTCHARFNKKLTWARVQVRYYKPQIQGKNSEVPIVTACLLWFTVYMIQITNIELLGSWCC